MVRTKDGDVTRLEVKAVGKPKPEGKWLKHGEEIVPSTEFMVENFEDGTSVLTITEVYPDDTGEITFEAHNPLGVAITTTELSVESKDRVKEMSTGLMNICYFSADCSAARYLLKPPTEYTFLQIFFTPNCLIFIHLFRVNVYITVLLGDSDGAFFTGVLYQRNHPTCYNK